MPKSNMTLSATQSSLSQLIAALYRVPPPRKCHRYEYNPVQENKKSKS